MLYEVITDYDNYVGKIGIARIFNGKIKKGDNVLLAKADGEMVKGRISKLIGFLGLNRIICRFIGRSARGDRFSE